MLVGSMNAMAQSDQSVVEKSLAPVVVREKADVLLLPERLVTFADGKATVEVPGAEDQAEPVKKAIKTGLSDGINIEVADGLKAGEPVVERPPKKIE